MMIAGLGTDIVAVARMASLYERYGERVAIKLLSPLEYEDFAKASNPPRFLARRFSAKEAFGKALGIGISPPATLPAIAVTHDALGKPLFAYSEVLKRYMTERGLKAHLSISDEREFAVAFVVLESQAR